MTPRVCADALWSEFTAHLVKCAECQAHPLHIITQTPTAALEKSCPEGWALLNTWGTALKRERAESVASEMQDCVDEL